MSDAQTVEQISAKDLAARLQRGDELILLDVRENEELALAKLDHAVHIPMGDVPSRYQQLDPDAEIVVLCHAGMRSYSVALWLKQQDYPNVKSLAGGIDAWSADVDPTVPRY